jgi:hypothetical protein
VITREKVLVFCVRIESALQVSDVSSFEVDYSKEGESCLRVVNVKPKTWRIPAVSAQNLAINPSCLSQYDMTSIPYPRRKAMRVISRHYQKVNRIKGSFNRVHKVRNTTVSFRP